MGWLLATVLFGSLAAPLGYWLNWSGQHQFGPAGAIALAIPVVGVVWFDVTMLLSVRSPFGGPLELGVTAIGLVGLVIITGLLLSRVGRAGATMLLVLSGLGLTLCVVLVTLGAPSVNPLLTGLGVVGLLGITGLLILRVTGASILERIAAVTVGTDRRNRLILLFVALLIAATLVLHVPSAVDSSFCNRPGEYGVNDVRIAYDRSAMIGSDGVHVDGRQIYYLNLWRGSESAVYRVGTVRPEAVRELMTVIERNGILCSNDQYTGITLLSGAVSEELSVSIETASKTIELDPAGAAPPQVERTIDALRETGQAQPTVNASEFCARLSADANTGLADRCRYLERTERINTSSDSLGGGHHKRVTDAEPRSR
jgi:hypothetical protein